MSWLLLIMFCGDSVTTMTVP